MSTTPRDMGIGSQGIIALSRNCPFVLLSLLLATFLEFLFEVLHKIHCVRVGFLIFSFRFDLLVQLVSRYLVFALTPRVVPLLTSTCNCVLVSVCDPDISDRPIRDPHVCFRACVGVLRCVFFSVFGWPSPCFLHYALNVCIFGASYMSPNPLWHARLGSSSMFCTTYVIGVFIRRRVYFLTSVVYVLS